jgi:hypothetical protein
MPGSQTLIVGVGLDLLPGQYITIASGDNVMSGKVISYISGSLVVDVTATEGSGTYNNWSITVYNTGSSDHMMSGVVTAYDSGTGAMHVNITTATGSGTYNSWSVVIFNMPVSGIQSGSIFQTIESSGFSPFTTQNVIGETTTWPQLFTTTAYNSVIRHTNGDLYLNNGKKILRVDATFTNIGDSDIIAKTISGLKEAPDGSLLVYVEDTQTLARYSSDLNFVENVYRTIPTIAGSFSVGTIYAITFLGTTDFTLIGASANIIGTIFIASGRGSGTGKATTVQTDCYDVADFVEA